MLLSKLEGAIRFIQQGIEEIEKAPQMNAILGLIEACQHIEERYEQFCVEQDEDAGDESGTTYKYGVSLEFYIEADDWHRISLQLRKLRELEEGLNEAEDETGNRDVDVSSKEGVGREGD